MPLFRMRFWVPARSPRTDRWTDGREEPRGAGGSTLGAPSPGPAALPPPLGMRGAERSRGLRGEGLASGCMAEPLLAPRSPPGFCSCFRLNVSPSPPLPQTCHRGESAAKRCGGMGWAGVGWVGVPVAGPLPKPSPHRLLPPLPLQMARWGGSHPDLDASHLCSALGILPLSPWGF